MKVCSLRTDHLTNPKGIYVLPEFSWKIVSDRNGTYQTSYKILIRKKNGEIVFDGEKIENDRNCFVKCDFALQSTTEYVWSVTVWDNFGNTSTDEAEFETAFLSPEEIGAKWIESPFDRNEEKLFTFGIENPAVIFSKKIEVGENIKSARLYATSYGMYAVTLNGEKPDDRELCPEFTPYNDRLLYQTFDVTDSINPGENKLEFTTANGWMFCEQTRIKTDEEHKNYALMFRLDVIYSDGTRQTFSSDGTETVWQTNIIYSDLFEGEKIDLTKTDFEEKNVLTKNYKVSNLVPQSVDFVRPIEFIEPKEIFKSPAGEWIVDFGQELSGRARIKINEPYGKEITFEYTEALTKEKNYFATMSLRQCDTVISDGREHLYEAKFTYHGFRYIRVTGIENPKKENFTAVLLSTKKKNNGSFECSDERFNRLYKNIRYSGHNNMCSYPTDCPSREKAGWTGDIMLYCETAMLNDEMTPFLTNYLLGLLCDQKENGVIPLTSPLTNLYDMVAMQKMIPFGATKQTPIAGWGDAIMELPYQMYKTTGNISILEKCFDAMKKWCDCIIETMQNERGSELDEELDKYLFNTGFQFGEWLVPGKPDGFEICKETSCYTTPFYAYRTLCEMVEVCKILGQSDEKYSFYVKNVKNAIQRGIFENDLLPDDYMGAYVLSFAFDLVDEKHYEEYKNRLIKLVEKNDYCLQTGFLATPYVLPALDKIGRHDLAMKILLGENRPSWLYEVKMGATTMWESWDALDEEFNPSKVSFDHYAFGVVDSYIFHNICGIRMSDVGYKKIIIEPDEKTFEYFKRTFDSESGEIVVEKMGDKLKIIIPVGCTATVKWKQSTHEIDSGEYIF